MIACDHCSLEFSEDVMIEDGGKHFCCKGCQGVFHLLQTENLDSFYKKKKGEKLNPVKEHQDSLEKFNLDTFKEKYITQKDGFSEISLIIEGIHCAACVWLNEKVLEKEDGIIDISINFTTHKAKILWDTDKLQLSQIIKLIRSIGYNAYPYDSKRNEERAYKARKEYLNKMAVAIFATMNIMWLAIARYLGYFTGMDEDLKFNIHIAEFLLATPTLFYSGLIFFKGAYFGLKNRIVNMDLLVVGGATLTYLFSIWTAFVKHEEGYFDSVAMIITFILVGKFLEVRSKKTAIDTLDTLQATIPTEVTIVKDGEKTIVRLEDVKVGDVIETKAGERVVFDSIVISGESSIDSSSLTGENLPEEISIGSKVLGGCENLTGVIRTKVEKSFKDSTLYSIINLLEDTMNHKPKIEKKANEISQNFSLTILLLAVVTFFAWLYYSKDLDSSIMIAVSVIIIACPCALALATPIATVVGIGTAAKRGILFKGSNLIETMAKANTLVLDKTGTITKGKPKVVKHEILKNFDNSILASLVDSSNHPIAKGVRDFFPNEEIKELTVREEKAKGLKCQVEGESYFGGNIKFIQECVENLHIPSIDNEFSHFIYADSKEIKAIFYLEDEIKEDAKDALKAIRDLGIELIMATGDKENSARKVAKEIGIERVYSELLPNEKAQLVRDLRKEGKIVVTTGDGINDSIALGSSDIAIAMHSGADTAINVSDIVLLDSSLNNLKDTFTISRRTYHFVKQNLLLSLIYNVITIPIAMAGFVIPLVAALSMSLSSLLVVGNSLRIKSTFKGIK